MAVAPVTYTVLDIIPERVTEDRAHEIGRTVLKPTDAVRDVVVLLQTVI